ncbi:Putative BolA protein [Septoria linicola]|uniref:BolA protein n=1 Tax=Septoria linicola TaxID=215465 RepID=A0A9Q9ANR7_9PEZI|nr:putative BolA protein [Septoria linicola]USW52669.1 Putative BolA protein [Septoria linicola]
MASRRLIPQLLRTSSRLASVRPRATITITPLSSRQHISPFSTSRHHRDEASIPPAASPQAPDYLDEAERRIFDILVKDLQPTKLEVQDISGGCGSMYALDIVSEQFKGLPVIKQHRLVNKVLGEEIKKWHGVQLKTKAP